MQTLDRYVLRETLKPLAFAFLVVLAALLLERTLRLVDMLVNKGGPFVLILKMLANLLPHYLGLALPAALFVSVLLVISKLCNDSEMDAMQGTGISLTRLVAPILALSILLTAVSAVLFGFIQPYTRYAFRATEHAARHAAWDMALEQGVFVTDGGRLTVTADDIGGRGMRMTNVFVNQELKSGVSVTTTAREGSLIRPADSLETSLALSDGVQIRWNEAKGEAGALTFSSLVLPLGARPELAPFRARGHNERELTIPELWRMRDAPDSPLEPEQIAGELHGRLARTLSLPLLPLLAVPFGMTAKRARRSYGIAAAAIVLISYDHLLQFGQSMVEIGRAPPWFGIWLPFSAFAAFSLAMFRQVGSHPRSNPLAVLVDGLEAGFGSIIGLARWRRKAG